MASASRATASASATLHNEMARFSSGIKGALTAAKGVAVTEAAVNRIS
jgi:hypothetical protein